MKKRVITLFAFFLIALIPFSMATETEIKIKTLPFHEVQVSTSDPNSASFTAYESFKGESDQYGDATFTFSSDVSTFDLIVYIKWQGEKVHTEKSDGSYTAGEPIYLEAAPAGARLFDTPETIEEVAEDTEEAMEGTTGETIEEVAEDTEEAVAEATEVAEPTITGNVIEDGQNTTPLSDNTLYYILGSLVLVGAIVFTFLGMKKSIKKKANAGKEKVEGKKEGEYDNDDEEDPRIKTIQEEIKKANVELDKIKTEEKIHAVEKKLEEDRKNLERLRKD